MATENDSSVKLEPISREDILTRVLITATLLTTAKIQENEIEVMKAVYQTAFRAIPTEEIEPALEHTIKARIAGGNTYPIQPLEIVSRWIRRQTEAETPEPVLTPCTCHDGFVVVRNPGKRPEVVPCPNCQHENLPVLPTR